MAPPEPKLDSNLIAAGRLMKLDIVIAGDWRLEGGICTAVDHEIRALRNAGLKVGLLPVGSHFKTGSYPLDSSLAQHVRSGNVALIANRSTSAKVLCIRHPATIPDTIRKISGLSAEKIFVIVDGPPLDGYGQISYDAATLHSSLAEATSAPIEWVPTSPVCRSNLKNALPSVPISDFDWINFVFTDEWKTSRSKPLAKLPTIGRHSRLSWEKLPDNRKLLLAAYPASPEFHVRFLGGGSKLKELAESWPSNWALLDWNAVKPQDFLKTIDFFVYFHNSAWVEGFGRSIMEAMASGCVVVAPHYLKPTFGDAAIYTEPEHVRSTVTELQRDWKKFKRQSARGLRWVESRYTETHYLAMVREVLRSKPKAKPQAKSDRALKAKSASPASKNKRPDDENTQHSAKDNVVLVSQEAQPPATNAENFAPVGSDNSEVSEASVNPSSESAPSLAELPIDLETVEPSAIRASPVVFEEFDIVYVIDVLDTGDSCQRIVEELEIARANGCCAGIVFRGLEFRGSEDQHPFLNGKVSTSTDQILDFNRWIAARLAIVVSPRNEHFRLPLRLTAEKVLAIADQSYRGNIRDDDLLLRQSFGVPVTWVATTYSALKHLEKDLPTADDLWMAPVVPLKKIAHEEAGSRLVVGYVAEQVRDWPSLDDAELLFVKDHRCTTYVRGVLPAHLSDLKSRPVVFDSDKISLRAFIAKIDVLIFYPAETIAELPLTAISLAMTSGIPVLISSHYADQISRGPNFVDPPVAHQTLMSVIQRPGKLELQRLERSHLGLRLFGPQNYYRRLAQHGISIRTHQSAPAASKPQRVMLFSANGTGLGHVSRQLAIARRFSDAVEPVFITLSHGVSVIREFGYVAEYIPSLSYTKADSRDWDEWLSYEIGRHIDNYEPSLIVYDGNAPPDGLQRAVGSRHNVKICWLRRAMWQQPHSPLIELQKYFDMIIEPAEIAGDSDKGATVAARSSARIVPPIRLLDDKDLLSRNDAATAIGFDPHRPAVLIHLGSGANRDNVALVDQIMPQLRNVPRLQIAIAAWETTDDFLQIWPGTTVLKGYPISQYFAAFDFSIAAAGYNTFHDVISFGLPTIFIPNVHPSMDDQRARAEYAEKHGAAITLADNDIASLSTILPLVLAEKSREFLRSNCIRLALDNGAEAAARLIETLAEP